MSCLKLGPAAGVEANSKPPRGIFDGVFKVPDGGVAAHVDSAAVGECDEAFVVDNGEDESNGFNQDFELQSG